VTDRESESPAEVREGLLGNRATAVETVRGWVAGLAYGAGWELADPESAIQEVTLRVLHLSQCGRIREDADFKAFVRTVARHTFTDLYRRERLRSRVESPDSAVEQSATTTGNPHRRLEEKEKRELLKFIFQQLSEECRRLWRWVYGDGLSANEVGSKLEISPVNARVRVHRCMKNARKIHRQYLCGASVVARRAGP